MDEQIRFSQSLAQSLWFSFYLALTVLAVRRVIDWARLRYGIRIHGPVLAVGIWARLTKWAAMPCSVPHAGGLTNAQLVVIIVHVCANTGACFLGYGSFLGTGSERRTDTSMLSKYVAIRTGQISFANVPLVLGLAGRNEILVGLTGVGNTGWHALHRSAGAVSVAAALAHATAYGIRMVTLTGLGSLFAAPFLVAGLVAASAGFLLMTHALGPIRRRCPYEVFVALHLLLALVYVIGSWYHASASGSSTSTLAWIYAGLGLLVGDHMFRWVRIAVSNLAFSRNSHAMLPRADLTLLPGEALRVEIALPRLLAIAPGGPVHLHIPGLSLWRSHPFTVLATSHSSRLVGEQTRRAPAIDAATGFDLVELCDKTSTVKLVQVTEVTELTKYDAEPMEVQRFGPRTNIVTLIVRKRTGMTKKLFDRAVTNTDPKKRQTMVLVEGTFRPSIPVQYYDDVLLIGAGVGITKLFALFQQALQSRRRPIKLTLIWAVKTAGELEWVKTELVTLAEENRQQVSIALVFHITGQENAAPMYGPSTAPVRFVSGRPDVGMEVTSRMAIAEGRMAVAVCGTLSMAREVRIAVCCSPYQADLYEEDYYL